MSEKFFSKFDPFEAYVSSAKELGINNDSMSEEEKEKLLSTFLDKLLASLSNEKSIDLVPYLSEIILTKSDRSIRFSICSERVAVRFEFKI